MTKREMVDTFCDCREAQRSALEFYKSEIWDSSKSSSLLEEERNNSVQSPTETTTTCDVVKAGENLEMAMNFLEQLFGVYFGGVTRLDHLVRLHQAQELNEYNKLLLKLKPLRIPGKAGNKSMRK